MSEILIKTLDKKGEKTKPIDLKRLSGIVSVGGDALEDTERFYSYNSDPRIKRGENYGGKGHQSENTGTS